MDHFEQSLQDILGALQLLLTEGRSVSWIELIHHTTQAWKRADGCIMRGLFKGCIGGGAPTSFYLGVKGEGQVWLCVLCVHPPPAL